jgi:hypothetical protein
MATRSNVSHSRTHSAAIVSRLRSYRLPPPAVPISKPEVVVLLHGHVCAACNKFRACNARPCWLRYRAHRKQREWLCPQCKPAGPAVAQPIAA